MENINNKNNSLLSENDIEYDKKDIVGSGAFGEVFLGRIKKNWRENCSKKSFSR